MPNKQELEEMRELAAEADRVLAPNSVFNRVLTNVTKKYIQELTQAPVYDLTARAAHAKLIALEAIKGEFRILSNNYKVNK